MCWKLYKRMISIILCFILGCINCSFVFKINTLKCLAYDKKIVRVQDDFYEAVNQKWLDSIKLNRGCVSYGTFQEVSNKVTNEIKEIIEEIEENQGNYRDNSDELKILNLYNQYKDTEKRNELGIKPIEKYLEMVEKIQNISDVDKLLSNKEFIYFQFLINLGVGADCKDSTNNILYISDSKLGLGNSYYYKHGSVKDAYIKYLTKLNILSGLDDEKSLIYAQKFYDMEKHIAQSILSKEEEAINQNKLEKKYNVYNLKQLSSEYSNINFRKMLKKFKLDSAKKIIVENPKNLKSVNDILVEENVDNVKIFFRTSILLRCDSCLTDEFREASSELRKILYGSEISEVNETNSVKFTLCYLDDIISKIYVNKYFDAESKRNVENMIIEIINNFKERLKKNGWLSNNTKVMAIKKLETLDVKIGYPETWKDYSGLKIKSYNKGGNLIDNITAIYIWELSHEFSKINKESNKAEWSMAPCTVNAYYNPINNEIVFPAAILQSPFYDKNNSKEENYGAIGVVIGHELTHAFDNTGCRFDEKGNLKNWWEENDYKEFEKRREKIAEYYSKVVTENGKHINGKLTVGENISDLGGMACALDVINKLDNPDYNKFFESYANMWREISTDEMKEYLLNNDCHAPKKIRVNEVVSQFEEFYKTYNVRKGDKMYVDKENRIGIW